MIKKFVAEWEIETRLSVQVHGHCRMQKLSNLTSDECNETGRKGIAVSRCITVLTGGVMTADKEISHNCQNNRKENLLAMSLIINLLA